MSEEKTFGVNLVYHGDRRKGGFDKGSRNPSEPTAIRLKYSTFKRHFNLDAYDPALSGGQISKQEIEALLEKYVLPRLNRIQFFKKPFISMGCLTVAYLIGWIFSSILSNVVYLCIMIPALATFYFFCLGFLYFWYCVHPNLQQDLRDVSEELRADKGVALYLSDTAEFVEFWFMYKYSRGLRDNNGGNNQARNIGINDIDNDGLNINHSENLGQRLIK